MASYLLPITGGTISVENGATTVTGDGTVWSGLGVLPGDELEFPLGTAPYLVIGGTEEEITNTALELLDAYGGATETGQPYRIHRRSQGNADVTRINAKLSEIFAALQQGRWQSLSEIEISAGTKEAVVPSGMAVAAGARLRFSSRANPTTHWFDLIVTVYDGTAIEGTVGAQDFAGSGTRSDWNINIVGAKGSTGAAASTPVSTTVGHVPTWGDTGGSDLAAGFPVTAFAKTVLDDADAAAARTTLAAAAAADLPRDNLIINPDGRINQRQASSGVADDTYAWDRHYVLTQTGAVAVSTVQNAANGVPHLMRITQSQASAQRVAIATILEAIDSQCWRGLTMTLAGKLRLSASANVRYSILAWTGTADTVTSDVVNSWTSGTYTPGNFFLGSNLTVVGVGSTALTAATLTDFALTGTVPASCNNLIFLAWTEGTLAQTDTFDLRWKAEPGPVPTLWVPQPRSLAMASCQGFFRTIRPGANSSNIGAVGVNATTTISVFLLTLDPPMRVAPSFAVGSAGDWAVQGASGADNACSGITNFQNSARHIEIRATVASGLVQGNASRMRTHASTGASAFMDWDAEL